MRGTVTAAPTLPAVDLMDSAHRTTARALQAMVQLAQVLADPAQDSAAAPLAARICQHFNGAERAHHESEETTVFPALLASGSAELREHVKHLQQDHMWLEEDWLELDPHLQAVARGYCNEHRSFLRDALVEFAGLCAQHMALEETLVHPRTGPVPARTAAPVLAHGEAPAAGADAD
jgi:hemerythrin-like domain-containing protein